MLHPEISAQYVREMREMFKEDPDAAVDEITKLSLRELNLFTAVAALFPKEVE